MIAPWPSEVWSILQEKGSGMKLSMQLALFISFSAFGFGTSFEDIQMKAETISKNKSAKTIDLNGKAVISQGKNKLSADRIHMDGSTGVVMASGNCVYENGDSSFKESKMNLILNGENWLYTIPKN